MAGTYFGLLALGVALMLPLAAVGVGIGEGMVFAAAIQGIARQPEAEGRIRNIMFVTFALVETLFIFTLVFFFGLKAMLPSADQITTMLNAH